MGSIRKQLEAAKDWLAGKTPALPKSEENKAEAAADKLGGYTKALGVDAIRKNLSDKQKALKELE